MSDMKRNRRGHGKHNQSSHVKTNVKEVDVDEKSPVIQLFRKFQQELDSRHDKYERIVKLSRDITIESKRIIFQLHRISGSPSPETVLEEALAKVKEIQQTKWKSVAKELHKEDSHRFLRAYSPGLQEYIEAVSFLFYLKEKALIDPNEVEKDLCFSIDTSELTSGEPSTEIQTQDKSQSEANKETATDTIEPVSSELIDPHATQSLGVPSSEPITVSVHVPPIEYMLGVADLTGELMRVAINSVGSGSLDTPFEVCQFMRVIRDAFVMFGNLHRELPRKLHTLTQSLKKVENACYTLQVRGSEIPKHMLKDVFSTGATEGPHDFEELT